MKKHLEIKPLEGLGNIKFGMSPSEVIKEMSEEQVFEGWMGGNRNNALLFKRMILTFDKSNAYGPLEDSRLVTILINHREDIFLFDKSMIDWNEENFLDYCIQKNIQTINHKGPNIDLPELFFSISFDSEDNNNISLEFWEPYEEYKENIIKRIFFKLIDKVYSKL